MKTNHRRGFKAPNFCHGQRIHRYYTYQGHGETVLSGVRVNAFSIVSGGSSKIVRRDKAGAKKFVRSRTRFHENAALKEMVKNGLP